MGLAVVAMHAFLVALMVATSDRDGLAAECSVRLGCGGKIPSEADCGSVKLI